MYLYRCYAMMRDVGAECGHPLLHIPTPMLLDLYIYLPFIKDLRGLLKTYPFIELFFKSALLYSRNFQIHITLLKKTLDQ